MESIWNKGIQKPSFKSLNGDIKTDVLVIGGGITGILCAYMLKQSGINCIVAEANKICGGVTTNTTAKITYQHGAIYDKMIKRFGEDTARLYLKANENAICEYRRLSKKIDCDFKESSNYVFSMNNREKIEKETAAYEKIGVKAFFETEIPLPFEIAGAVRVDNQAQFNPLKLIFSISKDLDIYENTKVLELTSYGALTANGKIKAQKIIVATHFPFVNKYGAYFLKMYQHRSYVVALKNAPNVGEMCVDEAEKGLSFRNYGNLLLIGGGGHRTGKKGGNWKELRSFSAKYYPQAKEVCYWATQDCKTLDDIPYIGQYSKRLSNVYVATGFNKWGMTSAMTAADILTDLISDRYNEFAKVFEPSRGILHPQLAINSAETIKSLLTPTVPRCPHMGCALKYNRAEHSWDCACHGSRFDKEGKLLDNPATRDIKRDLN